MDGIKTAKFKVSFPDPGLTPEQQQQLTDALKSAVVSVLTERIRGQVNVQPKVNDWSEDRATK